MKRKRPGTESTPAARPAEDPTVWDVLEHFDHIAPGVHRAAARLEYLIRPVELSLARLGIAVDASLPFADLATAAGSAYPFHRHGETERMTDEERRAAGVLRDVELFFGRHYTGEFRIGLRERVAWDGVTGTDGRPVRRTELLFEKLLVESPPDKQVVACRFLTNLLFKVAEQFDAMGQTAVRLVEQARRGSD